VFLSIIASLVDIFGWRPLLSYHEGNFGETLEAKAFSFPRHSRGFSRAEATQQAA